MSESYGLPDHEDIRKTLSNLLGKEVKVTEGGAALEPDDGQPYTVAVYQDADSNLAAVCVCDVALSSSVGAALALIPPGVVEDCVRSREIPDNIMENVGEVMNICVNLFQGSGTKRLRLSQVLPPGQQADSGTVDFCDDSGENNHFRVEIPGYVDGRMSLYLP